MFVLLSGLATIKAFSNFVQFKEVTQTKLEWTTRWIESEQHRHFAQARLVSFIVRNEIRKGTTASICKQAPISSPGLDTEFGQFAIADSNGNISCNTIPWLTAKNVADQEYFKQALKLQDLSYVGEANNQKSDKYEAIMARSIRDDGHVKNVILVAMDFSWILEEIDVADLPTSAHLLVVDSNHNLIAGTRNVANWVDKNISDSPFFKQLLAAKTSAYDGSGFDGADSLIVSRKFNTSAGEMRVIIDVPRAVLLQPAYISLRDTLLSSTAVFILILILAYYLSNRYLLHKIRIIEETAKSFAAGDLNARANLTGTNELDRLAISFDAMASTIALNEVRLREINEELFRVNRALRVLSAGNKSLLFAKTESELLIRVCHDIVEEGGYLAAWIGFTGPTHDEYLRTAASYTKTEEDAEKIDWNKAGNGLKPVINAVRENKILVINDTSHESVHRHLGEQAMKFGYHSVVVLPLHLEGKPFGALILTAYRENEFGNVQVEYLKETASDISFGIEMLRTKDERKRLAFLGEHHEILLRNSLEDALAAISKTIEMRDPYTAGHQKRVASLAKMLAQDLGLAEDEAHGIYLASIVHDIGKVNVPAEILVKPGKLNDIEYSLVKTHVESSYQILKDVQFPWPIADMAHQHHERLDGSGYPLGLKGGEISFGGRIIAVADVVEAMSSHRPYRASLGVEVALNEIQRGRGTIYDAAVVDACLSLFHEGRFKFD